MDLSKEKNRTITNYIKGKEDVTIESYWPDFNLLANSIRKFKNDWEKGKILEVGSGTGWLQIICAKKNIDCEGIEISPQLVDYSINFAKKYDVAPKIYNGNIENYEMGENEYDVIIACSVFEHVENWQKALRKVHQALKKGGIFYFISTNKLSLISGEYKYLPLYGILPDSIRYRFRSFIEGKDVMKLGIDFNQFSYPQLTNEFDKIGFSRIEDIIEFIDADELKEAWKEKIITSGKKFTFAKKIIHSISPAIINLGKKSKFAKKIILAFFPVTYFICKK